LPKISEFELQRAVCLWLDGYPDKKTGIPTRAPALVPGVLYWHTPNGGSRRDGFEGRRMNEIGVKAGIFDLSFLWGGLYVLELKAPDVSKLADAQRDMWARYERAGAAGIAWANTLESAQAQLRAWRLVVC
jgi:hypothetical protein